MVEFLVQVEEEKVGSRTRVLCLNRGEYGRMREELANVDWGSALEGRSAEEQWRIFKEIFLGAQQKFIPMVKKDSRRRGNKPWIMKEVKRWAAR